MVRGEVATIGLMEVSITSYRAMMSSISWTGSAQRFLTKIGTSSTKSLQLSSFASKQGLMSQVTPPEGEQIQSQ
jgi:hypothetical protein